MNTDILKERYLARPSRCPYCSSTLIEAEPIDAEGDTAWSGVTCRKCGKTWTDIYRLVDVKFADEK